MVGFSAGSRGILSLYVTVEGKMILFMVAVKVGSRVVICAVKVGSRVVICLFSKHFPITIELFFFFKFLVKTKSKGTK